MVRKTEQDVEDSKPIALSGKKPRKARKPRRYKPGKKALLEIKREQKNSANKKAIPKAPFERIMRSIANKSSIHQNGIRLSKQAIEAMQYGLESFAVDLFNDMVENMAHAGRKTINSTDLKLAVRYFEKNKQR